MNRTLSPQKRTFIILLIVCISIFTLLNIQAFSQIKSDLSDLDNSIMLALNYDGNPITDMFWFTISKNLAWVPLGITLLVSLACFRKDWYIPILIVVGLALVITISDQISSSLIKPYFERFRPSHNPDICDMLHYVNNYKGGSYGFVSSHAANAFGVFAFLVTGIRHTYAKIILFIWSCMVAYSRIYLGVHYPGDIVCGAILGATVGVGVGLLIKHLYSVINRRGKNIIPSIRQRYNVKSMPIAAIVFATSIFLYAYSLNRYVPFTFYEIMTF